jgi:hypothetical protein
MNTNENSSIQAFSLTFEALLVLATAPLVKSLEFAFDKSILVRLHYFQYGISY